MTDLPPTEAEHKAAETSLGDLLADVSRDVSVLMRQEVELAKAEIRDSATRAARGAALLTGAGVAGHFVLLFLSVALWWALGFYVTGLGWSAGIVALVWALICAVLALRGRSEIQKIKGLPRTAESLKKIPESVTPSEEPR